MGHVMLQITRTIHLAIQNTPLVLLYQELQEKILPCKYVCT